MPGQNYVLLERIELNTTASSVTFDNIPQTGYTDLKIVHSARTSRSAYQESILLNFNGVTTNRSNRRLYGTGSSVASTNDTLMYGGQASGATATASTFGNSEIYIPNYTSSNFKSSSEDAVSENNSTNALSTLNANLWSSTAAITSITLTPENGGSFQQYSTFALYGIADANTTPARAPKADGGNIIATDGTYWYHAFTSNGTFTPQVGLSCDILQIAGGGGGGYGGAGTGGGGAGGLLAFTNQTLASTGYAVTVGAGGAGGTSTNGVQGSNSQFGSLTASVGGGYGGGSYQVTGIVGGNGGSGGGAGAGNTGTNWGQAGGTATSGQGFAGGVSINSGGGGGGGAGEVGSTDGTGHGGDGVSSYSTWGSATLTGENISGTYWYAGGGGGSTYPSTQGIGGSGGGGNSGIYSVNGAVAVAGTTNTGGGGGGAGYANNNPGTQLGGAGGSGIIIVRYAV